MTFRSSLLLLALLLLAASAFGGCQKPGEVVPVMTQEQWRRVQMHLLESPGHIQFPVDAVFDERVRLVGWSADPASVEAGGKVTLTFYWEVLREFEEAWTIFLHMENRARQTADHDAIDNMYPTPYWRPGEIIRDIVRVDLRDTFPPGELTLYTGFFRGDRRLPVTRAGDATLEDDGRLRIGSLPIAWDPPRYQVRYTPSVPVIDGTQEPTWRRARRSDPFVHPSTGAEVEGLDTHFQALWDDNYLYLYLTGIDSDVWATYTERDSNLWEEEVFEVFIDHRGDGTDYIELQVNPLNTQFDARFESATQRNLERARPFTLEGWETAVHVEGEVNNPDVEDERWSVEMRIPWAALEGMPHHPPQNNDTLRINFYRYDRTRDGQVRTLAWSPVGGGTFHQPDRFGEFVLIGRPAALPQPETHEAPEPPTP